MVWPLYATLHNRSSRPSDHVVAQDDEQDLGKWWMDPYFCFQFLVPRCMMECSFPFTCNTLLYFSCIFMGMYEVIGGYLLQE
jgi:hypothetical protein